MAGWTPAEIWTTVRRARLLRILVVYLGASFAVIEGVDIFAAQAGLPEWVTSGAIVLLLIGLPIIVATALVQSSAAGSAPGTVSASEYDAFARADREIELEDSTSASDVAGVAKHWLTWRKAILGGVLAFALLGVTTTAYMTMRVLGIGPVGSLVAAGVLDERERIILADFENLTEDSLLAVVVTEAFRIDFAQSPAVTVAEPGYIAGVLARMDREAGVPLDRELAREVAIREGLRAVVAGEIAPVGTQYVLSTEIIVAESGEVLAAFRERAKDSDDILDAIDRLSKQLRERIGESFKTINASPRLDRVTTSSLGALKKFTQAKRAIYTMGEHDRGIALLEEAIALDTAFAAAYSELSTTLSNRREERARAVEAMTKAFHHRDRLTERERYVIAGNYYYGVVGDKQKAIEAYRTVLETYPDDEEALNNLAVVYFDLRDFERTEELMHRAVAIDSSVAVAWGNVMIVQAAQGKYAEAEATLEEMRRHVPNHPSTYFNASAVASSRGDYETAAEHLRALREARRGNLAIRASTSGALATIARTRGQLGEAESLIRDAMEAEEERDLGSEYLGSATALAWLELVFRGDAERALSHLEAAVERYPLESLDPLDRPYLGLAQLEAWAGRPERARELVEIREATLDADALRRGEGFLHNVLGAIALAEGRVDEAIGKFRAWDQSMANTVAALPDLAEAHDRAGQPDSVIAILERYLETPWLWRVWPDSWHRADAYERLGQLHEERGDAQKATYYYGKLVELWQDADPELQPRVASARRAIAALATDR